MVNVRALERSWSEVRRLAGRYPDEWEGEDLEGVDPVWVFAPPKRPRRILVVTKHAVLSRWERQRWPPDLAVVIARGMLTRGQARAVGGLDAAGRSPIRFLGDADPMDLHAYLSLRACLGARRVHYCGISDALLDRIGDDAVQPERLRTLRLSRFEREHLRVVETLIDPVRLLGPRVASLLRAGEKIETELLGFRADLIAAMFEAAVSLPLGRGSGAAAG